MGTDDLGRGGAEDGSIVWRYDPDSGLVGSPDDIAQFRDGDRGGEAPPAGRLSWRYDPDTGIVDGPDELARLHGLDPAGGPLLAGRLVAAYGYPAGERLEIALERATAGGAGFDIVARLPANGSSRIVRIDGRARYDDGAVAGVEGTIEDITATVEAERRAWRAASTDEATGLVNHLVLEDRLAMAVELFRRMEPGFALVLLAIEKRVQSHWERVDDADMVEIAARLATVLRDSDTLARIGSDAFALLLPGAVEIGRIIPPLDRVQRTIRLPVEQDGATAEVPMTCGVALFPKHGETRAALMRTAEKALLQAQRARLTSDAAFCWSLGDAGGALPPRAGPARARSAYGRG